LKGIIVYNSLYTMSFLKLIHHIGRFGFIGTLVLSLLFIFPQKSLAFLGVADVVIDPTNLVQNTVSAVANPVTAAASGITAAMTTAEKIKEYVLDPAARAIVRGIIQRLTAQTVNWINSGFKGNPAYVTDPGQFFLNVGDDVASNFLSSTRLNALCSPFRAQVRVALVKNYLNETSENFSCTLSRVKDNYESFMNDFSQGGWDGWFEVTQNNSNNPYGAYLDYSGALEKAVNAEKNKYDKQLDQGKGFLSYEKCPAGKEVKKCLGTEAQVRVETCPNGKPPFGGTAVRALCDFGVAPTVTWTKQCTGATEDSCKVAKETVTPGSVIESQLENALGSGIRQLELTRSFDEIVSALITQLFTRVVGGGQKDVPNSDSLRGDGRNIIPPPEGVRGGPLIVLLGKDTMEVVLGNKFTDPGASAFDPLDGDISKNVIATGEVDVNILGTYTLRYNVKNSKGISADEVTLIVNVVEPAEPPPGNTTTKHNNHTGNGKLGDINSSSHSKRRLRKRDRRNIFCRSDNKPMLNRHGIQYDRHYRKLGLEMYWQRGRPYRYQLFCQHRPVHYSSANSSHRASNLIRQSFSRNLILYGASNTYRLQFRVGTILLLFFL